MATGELSQLAAPGLPAALRSSLRDQRCPTACECAGFQSLHLRTILLIQRQRGAYSHFHLRHCLKRARSRPAGAAAQRSVAAGRDQRTGNPLRHPPAHAASRWTAERHTCSVQLDSALPHAHARRRLHQPPRSEHTRRTTCSGASMPRGAACARAHARSPRRWHSTVDICILNSLVII